jgi:GTP-binding protein HflX
MSSEPTTSPRRRALLVAVDHEELEEGMLPAQQSLDELTELVTAAGDDVVGRITQRLETAHPVSYVGRGKVDEIRQMRDTLAFDALVADDELSAAQQRHLENTLDLEVTDRAAVILDIFAKRARTKEGRLQVELAQYRYRLPRLTGRGVELSRLGAGINTRGPGETKLETDRRRIRTRISELTKALDDVRRQRSIHRRQRVEAGLPVIALTGYTNAGKSTLMNALTEAQVLSSSQVFATLDPTVRQIELPTHLRCLLTDTVGFIQKLPTDLVAAFRATLEEIVEADCILHVLDVSDPNFLPHAEAVEAELTALGVERQPRVTALNKTERIEPERLPLLLKRFPNAVAISALTGTGLEALTHRLSDVVSESFVKIEIEVPYTAPELLHLVRRHGIIEKEDFRSQGTFILGRVPTTILSRLEGIAKWK